MINPGPTVGPTVGLVKCEVCGERMWGENIKFYDNHQLLVNTFPTHPVEFTLEIPKFKSKVEKVFLKDYFIRAANTDNRMLKNFAWDVLENFKKKELWQGLFVIDLNGNIKF